LRKKNSKSETPRPLVSTSPWLFTILFSLYIDLNFVGKNKCHNLQQLIEDMDVDYTVWIMLDYSALNGNKVENNQPPHLLMVQQTS
jgi:hypothetical protein